MKKTFAALAAALMMTFGLVATTATTATGAKADTAAKAACPYTNCIPTKTKPKVQRVVPLGKKVKVCAKVKPIGSNATPVGRIKFNVRHKFGEIVAKRFVTYGGGTVCIKSPKLTIPGQYALRVKYKPDVNSVFLKSGGIKKFLAR